VRPAPRQRRVNKRRQLARHALSFGGFTRLFLAGLLAMHHLLASSF